MTKEEKALLDMIAYGEGTLGVSNNGYDVVVGYKRIIAGWTKTTDIIHGGNSWIDKQTKSTAAGRYQFIYGTWIGSNKLNLPMTKHNQDKRGIQIIDYTFKNKNIDKTKIIDDKIMFELVLKCLSTQWASFIHAVTNETGYNKGSKTSDDFYTIYSLSLSKYV